MIVTLAGDITFIVEVEEWAHYWAEKDRDYIKHAAMFGSPLVSRIANFILHITGNAEVKKEK